MLRANICFAVFFHFARSCDAIQQQSHSHHSSHGAHRQLGRNTADVHTAVEGVVEAKRLNPLGKFLHAFDWNSRGEELANELILDPNGTANMIGIPNATTLAGKPQFVNTSVETGGSSKARGVEVQSLNAAARQFAGSQPQRFASKDARIERMRGTAWKQNLTLNSRLKKRRAVGTCQIGATSCKSLCRWLKLTDKDFNYNSDLTNNGNFSMCPLLDWSMESCGYVLPEKRHPAAPEPVDCVVDYIRRNVFKDDVPSYVEELEECMLALPRPDAVRYTMPLEVLTNEINEWKSEQAVRAAAASVQVRLQTAISHGKDAFETQMREEDSVQELLTVMRQAENITGHYLIDDIRTARELLDKIEPHLTVKKELKKGISIGKGALRTRSPSAMIEALVWLNVSIASAEQLGVVAPPDAVRTREQILQIQAAAQQLRSAVFQANVSFDTKMDIPLAIASLNESINEAIRVNVSDRLPVAREMVSKLVKIRRVALALQDSMDLGRMRLTTNRPEEEGISDFTEAIDRLDVAIGEARSFGLDDQVSEATKILKGLKDVKRAGKALHSAISTGRDVLLNSTSIMSDDNEEAAASILSATIPWAQNSGLTHGMPIAKALLGQLRRVEKAKEHMSLALAKANASLTAKAGETEAIDALLSSIREEQRLNLTSGISNAKRNIKQLRATQLAREDLAQMVEKARTKLNARDVRNADVDALNASINEASKWGLGREVALASSQLERLDALLEAQVDLAGAMASALPRHKPPQATRINQTLAAANISEFDRTGLQVVDLPDVPGTTDDGDNDFEEHIRRLNRSIAKAKSMGLVDPDMLVQLDRLQELQAVWGTMQQAVAAGEVAVNSKSGLSDATVGLEAAIEEAEDAGLSAGVDKAKRTLRKLEEIPPLRDELDASMLQANISLSLMTGMHEALMRLTTVIDHAKELHLTGKIPRAEALRDRLMVVNEAWLHLRAASVQGTVALRLEHGEEAAIQELTRSIHEAEASGLHAETPTAVELLQELMHMNAEHQQIQAAVVPGRAR